MLCFVAALAQGAMTCALNRRFKVNLLWSVFED
jgi:hypothetical protein